MEKACIKKPKANKPTFGTRNFIILTNPVSSNSEDDL